MKQKKVFLVRHGETDACGKEDVSNKDVLMNARGREQVAQSVKKIPRTVAKILVSPTLRTMEAGHMIQEHSLFATVATDVRLHNKMENDDEYCHNISSLLQDLREDPEQEIVLVTHGRIIKMIFSILTKEKIDRGVMDILDLSYGKLTILQYGWFCSLLDG